MLKRIQRLHFVGIGGIGMSGIAELLLNLGYEVSGSDLQETPITCRLADLGGTIVVGHRSENISGAHVVVRSSAVPDTNPELIEAREQGIPVIPRAEMLAELMRMKHGVAIAGSHGKTTTTSMVASVLEAAGLDPTVVIGGRLEAWGSNARLGKGEFLVAEADESDGSFLRLTPTIAVVTNIDAEHLEAYHDFAHLRDAFVEFLNKVPFYGTGVVCLDDPTIQEIVPQISRRLLTYGLNPQADLRVGPIRISPDGTTFTASSDSMRLGEVRLPMLGRHNALNAMAAVAVGLDLQLDFETIAAALAGSSGADRRLQQLCRANDILVVDDYGHHPTEIRAVLTAVKEAWQRRTIVCFQPHRYSRSQQLREEFGRAFYEADKVIVLPIYAAGEEPIAGVSGENLAAAVREHGHKGVQYAPDFDAASDWVVATARPGDLLLTLGAGDVWKLGRQLADWLQGSEIELDSAAGVEASANIELDG